MLSDKPQSYGWFFIPKNVPFYIPTTWWYPMVKIILSYSPIFPVSIFIYIYVFIQEYISPIFQDLIPCNRGLTVPKQTSGDTAGEDHQIHGPRGWNRWRRWGRWQPAVRWWLSVRWIVEIQEKVGDQGICILYINYIYYIYFNIYKHFLKLCIYLQRFCELSVNVYC